MPITARTASSTPSAATDNPGYVLMAAVIAALTDSSGGAAADGTIGAVTAPTALTDNGGGTANGTVEAVTATTAITDNGGGAAADGTIAAITLTEPANLAAQATINNQLADAVKELSTKINTIITWQTAVANNFKELTTAQAANRLAIVALTDAITELATKQNAVVAAMKTAGQMATA